MKLILLVIFFILISCDYTEELSGGYFFYSESNSEQVITKKSHGKGDEFITCNVIAYNFNDDFILAAHQHNLECFWGEGTFPFKLVENQIYFWIISHRLKKVVGPLSIQEFLLKRNELKVPEKLKLELSL